MPISHHLFAAALVAILAWGSASAYTLEEFQFDTPQQEADFRELIGKLRCLVCQNESLAASQADLAQDLRQEVYDMMHSGKDKDEIIDFLVARYGDFVLYQPPVKPSTYLLWFGPFVLIALGGFLLLRALRHKGAEPEQEVSADDEARIDALLKDETKDDDASREHDK
jgi:cytochrome c-type biogenesis protein CcmH